MEVQVWYDVPVACHVDTETGQVTRVVVVDELIALDPRNGVTLRDFSGPAPSELHGPAVEAAETRDWPAWEHGY